MGAYTNDKTALFRDPDTAHWEFTYNWFDYQGSARQAGWVPVDGSSISYPWFRNQETGDSYYPDGLDGKQGNGIPGSRRPNTLQDDDWVSLCQSQRIKPGIVSDLPPVLMDDAKLILKEGRY